MYQSRIAGGVVMAVSVIASACVGERAAPVGVVYRDSAGIRIAEIQDDTRPTRYALGPVPLLSIGGLDVKPEAVLFGVMGAGLMEDGSVVVASSGTHDLKVFDSTGRFVRSVGRRGEGPGEFEDLTWLAPMQGDSIIVYDWRQSRVQVFDGGLELGRLTILQAPGDMGSAGVEAVGVHPDGRLLGRGSEFLLSYPGEALIRHVFTMSPVGEITDSIGPFPGGRRIWTSGEPWPPFPRNAAFVPWGEYIYTAVSEGSEFRRITMDGRADRIVRGGLDSRPPDDADIEAAMRGRPPSGTGDPWVSPLLPYWSEMVVDDLGMVWRRGYARPGATEVRWLIVSPDATTIATLHTPLSFVPLRIAEDWVLALEKDSLDVERVTQYEMTRGGG